MHTGVKWNSIKSVIHHQMLTVCRHATEFSPEKLFSHFLYKRSEEWALLEFLIGDKWPICHVRTNFSLYRTCWSSCQHTIQICRYVSGYYSHQILLRRQVCYKYLPIGKLLPAMCTGPVPMICTEASDKSTIATTPAQQEGKCRDSNQVLES